MLILKIAIVIVGWLLGFIAHKKHRQVFLAIPALITIAVLFVDSSHINELGNTVKSLFDSYRPIEKTALERYPDLPKEKAIEKYLEDLNNIKKEYSDNKRELSDLRTKTLEQEKRESIAQNFTEVASWNYAGGKDLGGGIGVSGPPAGLLGKHISNKDGKIIWQCDSEALSDYREIIKQYPKYPFPYLYMGICLKNGRDHSWKTYGKKGIELFMNTTMIPNHNDGHDAGLKLLKEALKE
jgi:hypothetical protein